MGVCEIQPSFSPFHLPSFFVFLHFEFTDHHILFYETCSSLFSKLHVFDCMRTDLTLINTFYTCMEFEFLVQCLSCLIAHRDIVGFEV